MPRRAIRAPAGRMVRASRISRVADIVTAQHRLLEHLGVRHLRAVVGPSYGGFQAFQWAVTFPDDMDGIVPVVSSPRAQSRDRVATLLARFERDPNWHGGDYYDTPGIGAASCWRCGWRR